MPRLNLSMLLLPFCSAGMAFASEPTSAPVPNAADEKTPLVAPDAPAKPRVPAEGQPDAAQLNDQIRQLMRNGAGNNTIDPEQLRAMQEKVMSQLQQHMNRVLADAPDAPQGVPMQMEVHNTPNGIVINAHPVAVPHEKAAFLGVITSAPTAELREKLGLDKGVGLHVDFVEKDSPADVAGLHQGDIMTKLDDQILINAQQLAVLVRTKKPADSITLTIDREAKPQTLTAKLVERDLPVLDDSNPWLIPNGNAQLVPVPQGVGMAAPGLRVPGNWQSSQRVTVHTNPDGSTTRTISNNKGTLTINTTADGKSTLVAADTDGKELFNGPINTDEEKKKLPADVAEQLEKAQSRATIHIQQSGNGAGRSVQIQSSNGVSTDTLNAANISLSLNDNDHQMTMKIDGTGDKLTKTLTVKDTKTGKVLFDGPVTTEEDRKKLPEDIAAKLKNLEAKIDSK